MKLPTFVMCLACATTAAAADSQPTGIPVSPPRYAFKPLVEDYYPAVSRNLKEQGITKLKLCYDDRGSSNQVTVDRSSSFARLDEAAVRWGKAVRIVPGLLRGQPQPGCVAVPREVLLGEIPGAARRGARTCCSRKFKSLPSSTR